MEGQLKTVVIISGQLRSFAECLPSQRWQVYRRLTNPVFFVSCAKDDQAQEAELLKRYYPEVHIEHIEQPKQLLVPKWDEPKVPQAAHPFPPSTDAQGILKQLWSLNRAWEFIGSAVEKGDWVIRQRPDLLMRRFERPNAYDGGANRGGMFSDMAYLPAWSRWGGVNDRFGIMGASAAKAYFTTFQRVQELCDEGCPLHPESLVMGSMEKDHINIQNTLVAEFDTLRMDGMVIRSDANVTDIMDLTGRIRPYRI